VVQAGAWGGRSLRKFSHAILIRSCANVRVERDIEKCYFPEKEGKVGHARCQCYGLGETREMKDKNKRAKKKEEERGQRGGIIPKRWGPLGTT